jgi:hypothetical protein
LTDETGKRSLAEVSAEIRDLTTRLNDAMSEGASMHELRIDVRVELLQQVAQPTIPRLRVEQFKRIA